MFYDIITKKRDEWLSSPDCPVKSVLMYIEVREMLRDAQLDAIKTYLFLKIACENKPLWRLFVEGKFNYLDADELELTGPSRRVMAENPAALALYQYSILKDKNGKQLAPELEKFIRGNADKIDYERVFREIFYNVNYTDYLFSLPMGAGKTYLMAAFIYLDLYFALNEPENPSFAHNFLIMAPSGLKSSIIPSLKNIREFDPTWVLPEPTATQIKRIINFEVLDEQKSASKSNRVKNPNAQKINYHQPLDQLFGLVAITNAEKVILDHYDQASTDPTLYSTEELKQIAQANELRSIIGQIPNLAVYIDEVHHAADSEIKLRQVVEGWAQESVFNSVLGFSGTPYLDKAEPVELYGGFSVKNTNLTNVVYYYPLIKGLGNFLKIPEVRWSDADTVEIVRSGVVDFLDKYGETVYSNGTVAKLAIYCGLIDTLEEVIYPMVSEIVSKRGMNPAEVILKYHNGNKKYPEPEGAEAEFASLDTVMSKYRIVLLVQIGKEGWDCKSLTGVILPQKGACPTNMVLQTSCRCLRQVDSFNEERAIIWLNRFNSDTLNKQLKQQQNIGLDEFSNASANRREMIDRASRMERLKVPPIDFYQLKVSYETLIVDKENHCSERLNSDKIPVSGNEQLVYTQDFSGNRRSTDSVEFNEEALPISFQWWIHTIAKESFGTLGVNDMIPYEAELRSIFERITKENDGSRYFLTDIDQEATRSLIRCAFVPKRDFAVHEEVLPHAASLLQIEKFFSPVSSDRPQDYYPSQKGVDEVLKWDEMKQNPMDAPEVQAKIRDLEAMGIDISLIVDANKDPYPEREYTYHYLPYHFDSGFERNFFVNEIVPMLKNNKLEVYYNGDDLLTGFKINCFRKVNGHWRYAGRYVPDFLVIERDEEGKIYKVLILETKGEGFSAQFADKRRFMEEDFVKLNNKEFGYERFDFLYIEDTQSEQKRADILTRTIKNFFKL